MNRARQWFKCLIGLHKWNSWAVCVHCRKRNYEQRTNTKTKDIKKENTMKIAYNPKSVARKEARLSTEPKELTESKEVARPESPSADMSMTKAELMELAQESELSTKGTKKELVDRINAKY